MTYTIRTRDNSTDTITDTVTSLKAALSTARSRRHDSTGGSGSQEVYSGTQQIAAWAEYTENSSKWVKVCF